MRLACVGFGVERSRDIGVELVDGVGPSDEVADELIAFCRERLAGYKCPRSVEFRDALPRNETGKVLKRDLREPHWQGHATRIGD